LEFDTGTGAYSTFDRNEHQGNLILVVPLELRTPVGPEGEFQALVANVADLDTGEVFLNASGINGAMAETLAKKIGGNPVLGILDKYRTKANRMAWGTRLPAEEVESFTARAKAFASEHPELFGATPINRAVNRAVEDDGLAALREEADAA
jgi:hypothetical protein